MNGHWRDSMKDARFFMLDARAAIFFVFCLLHIRLWTLLLALVMSIIFWVLERYGLSFSAAFRRVRTWLIGKKRTALVANYRRWRY